MAAALFFMSKTDAQPKATHDGLLYPSLSRDTVGGKCIRAGVIMSGQLLATATSKADGKLRKLDVLWSGDCISVTSQDTARTFTLPLEFVVRRAIEAGVLLDVVDFEPASGS